MKIKDFTKEQARKICKENKGICQNCKFKRLDPERNKLLLCYWILERVLGQEEIAEMQEEEVKE